MWPGIVAATHPLTPACPRLRAPIILAHGLFGFRRIGVGPLTLTWYFRGIPGILQAAGNRVLVTRGHPPAGVARRAKKLGEQILQTVPDEPVHLIGHSMGGQMAHRYAAVGVDLSGGGIDRMATINTILDAAPIALREALLERFLGVLFTPTEPAAV